MKKKKKRHTKKTKTKVFKAAREKKLSAELQEATAPELSVAEKCVRNVSESLSGVGRRFLLLVI